MGNDWPSRTHSPMQNVNHGIFPIHSTQVAYFSTHWEGYHTTANAGQLLPRYEGGVQKQGWDGKPPLVMVLKHYSVK